MLVLLMCILWTWGLTPLWVNILGTVLCGLKILWRCIETIADGTKDNKDI